MANAEEYSTSMSVGIPGRYRANQGRWSYTLTADSRFDRLAFWHALPFCCPRSDVLRAGVAVGNQGLVFLVGYPEDVLVDVFVVLAEGGCGAPYLRRGGVEMEVGAGGE